MKTKTVVISLVAVTALAMVGISLLKYRYEIVRNEAVAHGDALAHRLSDACAARIFTLYNCLQSQIDTDAAANTSTEKEIADWTFGMLLVSLGTAAISLGGLYWVARSIDASRRANELSALAIKTSERPWIIVHVEQAGPYEKTEKGFNIPLDIVYTNKGNTPALRAHSWSGGTVYERQKDALRKGIVKYGTKKSGEENGILLAPGQIFRRPWFVSYDCSDDDIGELDGAKIASVVYGAVHYGTNFDEEIHLTAFVFIVEPARRRGKVTFRPWAGGLAT